jgi:hypothetical protein
MSWTNEELSHAVARDEQLCRSNGMTDKVTFSYWDHVRRFRAWRIDDYRPTRAAGPGPTPGELMSVAERLGPDLRMLHALSP